MLLKVYKSSVWILLVMLLPFFGAAQIPGLPAGWGFTQNPTSHVLAVPTTVTFDGIAPLAANDWVGAFYNASGTLKCAGAVQWTGTGNVAVVAFGNDTLEAIKNGFWANELIQWKVYRTTTSVELCAKAYDAANAEFSWANGAMSAVAEFGSCAPPPCELSLNLTPGWNWISFNVLADAGSDLNTMLGAEGYTEGDFIQTIGFTADYYEGYGWFGDLENIDPDWMYQMKLAGSKSVDVVGPCIDVTDPINIGSGWNWIGYKPQGSLAINDALTTLTPAEGDFIQTIGFTADYYEGYGWFGDLEFMFPGKGYMMKMAGADVLNYPEGIMDNSGFGNAKVESPFNTAKYGLDGPPAWTTPPAMAYTTTNKYQVFISGVGVTAAGSLLSAWKDGNIRGLKTIADPPGATTPPQFSIQLWSDFTTEPGFTFKVWDAATDQVYDITESITFIAGSNQGLATAPIPLNAIIPCQNPPTANAGQDFGVCAGGDAYLNGTATYYEALLWSTSGTGSFSIATTEDPIYTPSTADITAGFVTLTLKATKVGCPDATDDVLLAINALPIVTCPANMTVNSTDPAFALTGATPVGGDYSGPGVLVNIFTPSVAGAGVHTITYDYTDGNGCDGSCQFTITVNLVVTIDICGTVTDALTLAPIEGAAITATTGGGGGVAGPPSWTTPPAMAYTTTNKYQVFINGTALTASGSQLSAWKNGLIRGLKVIADPPGATTPPQFSIQLWSDLTTEPGFAFKVYDAATNMIYDITETITFIAGSNQGLATAPIPLNAAFAPPLEYSATTEADGTYCMVDVETGTYDITAEKALYITGVANDVVVAASVTQNFALVRDCQDVVITNFPAAQANVCVGTAVSIDFTNVVAENAASVWFDSSPVEAGGWANSVFVLNTNYVGVVTITYVGYATPPCLDATETLTFEVYPLPVVECPSYEPLCADAPDFMLPEVEGGSYWLNGMEITEYLVAEYGTSTVTLTVTDENGCSNSCEFTIEVNELPVFDCPEYGPFCAGDDAVVFEGVGVYTYNNEVVTGFDPAVAGSYLFVYTVTENGCSASCEFTIVVNPTPEALAPDYGSVCEGSDYIAFSGPVGYVYSYNGEPVPGFDPVAAGTYIFVLTVTNEFGCFDAVGFTIVVNPLPVFNCPAYGPYDAGDPAVVFEETGIFTLDGLDVLGFNPETAGEYLFTYTVTELGCSASCEFTIVVNPVIPPVCPGWVNVQWPPSGTITVGDDYTVYAQIWIDGVTQLAGATPGLSVAIGYSTENTNPDSWTNWVPANYNLDAGNNDEFMANIGAVIPAAGVYYYASRFIYNNCDVVYGGLGGFWDGVNNVSGVLTVEPGVDCMNPATAFAGADAAVCADVDYLIADATATNYTAVQWYTLTGDGTFDDETLLNPTYTPGTLDLIAGSVELCFTALPSDQLCDPAFDCMVLTFNALPVVTCPDNFAVCLNTPAFDLTGGLPAGGTYSDIHGTTVSFDPAIEGVGTHEFTYTYADGNGCSSACTFTITVNPLPTYSYELSATELCYGEEITYTEYFTGTAPWTVEYYWNGELETFTTSENPSITTEVLYETSVYEPVSVTDGNGCTVSVDQPSTITVNPLPTYSYELSATDLCYGEEVTYTEYFTGTAPWTVEYLWNGELETFTTSDNPSITTEVLYETSTYEPVSVTDGNGCSSLVNEPGTITVHPLPTYSYELSATEICYGEEVTYTEYFTGTAPWTVAYYWNGELETFTTSDNPSITSEVLYETSTYEPVSVTDGNGCSSLVNEPSTITVNPLPWIQVTTDLTEVCLNEVITITTVGPEDGDYPFAIVVSVNGTQQPMTLNGPLGVMPFTAPAAGVYDFAIVSITSAKGCVAYPEIEFTLTVNPLPTFTAEVSSTEVCFGQSVTFTDILTGTAPWTVEMLENGVPSSFIVLESPSYFTTIFTETTTQEFVSVTDANGCSNDLNQSITVTVLPLPEIVAQPEDVSELYGGVAVFTVGAQFADSYQWYGPLGMIDGETGMSLMIFDIAIEDEGEYYVAVTNECETINSDVVTLEVRPWSQVIGLPSKVNGVSTYLNLDDNSVANNVVSLGNKFQYFSFMRPDQTYVPGGVSFPWTEERGAKLGLKNNSWPTSDTVIGYPTLGQQVTLPAGWSLLPVWSQIVVTAESVLDPLWDNGDGPLVLAMGVTYANAYWPAKSIYTLQNLVPGRAYLVNLTASATVDFSIGTVVDKAVSDEVLAVNNTNWNDVENTGTMHAIAITTDAFAQLERRDVIGVFNQNGTIAGMVEIDNLNDNVFVSVYADNSFTNETEGFVNGDMMSFKVYRNGEVIDATATFESSMPNTNIFNEEGISVITGLKLSATSINEVTSNLNAQIFPNPAKNVVNIQTNFEISSLKVINYVGQVVFDRAVDQMNIQINTSSFGPGMYVVQIQSVDGTVITKRLTIN